MRFSQGLQSPALSNYNDRKWCQSVDKEPQ